MAVHLASLLALVRFSHTVFAMPFALIAVLLAWSLAGPGSQGPLPDGWLLPLVGVVVCMVSARTAAMAFNRLVDRDVDEDGDAVACHASAPQNVLRIARPMRWSTIFGTRLSMSASALSAVPLPCVTS